MTTLSTHVLDAGLGAPAAGVAVTLSGPDGHRVAGGTTDADGRLRFEEPLSPGTHRLLLETGAWFDAAGRDHLHPEVVVAVTVADRPHLHVALLLGPWSYTTYRGS
ncbi:5-hydroxyisourate hydrolase [Marmoricola sp. Leaf446]|uniref:hydroxyisourate hydrolase n=1 Tax=Marmoricola sp. Leaf446 TaxID=1736379 RepID=UPI0006FB6CD1|nr:hydroxyisourate hydrolase [Marmoricola sp. Leaf446]KQT90735.1 5-hydroxyisourate hydrolase [Marmoricola sp. Leaf446]